MNFFLKSFFFLAQLSRTLSNPTDPGSYSTTSDKGGRFRSLTSLDLTQITFAIPSMNPARVMSRQICDAYPQISEQYFIDISSGSQSGVSQDPPTSPPHRISLMARVSLGPSVTLLSVGTSTAHDEPQSWQLGLLFASSPTIVSVLQGGGDSDLSLPTSTNLGFCWMGRIPSRGPIAPTWPNYKSCTEAHTSSIFKALYNIADPSPLLLKPRSAPLNALFSLVLKICYSIKNGRRRCSISVTKSLDETCYYKSENLMARVAWLSPDASLILKLMEIEFLSKHRWCDVDHASALSCEYISSLNLSIMTLNHPATILVGDASQYSRTLWMNPLKQFEIVPIQWSQPEVVLSSLFSLQPSRTSFNYSQNTLGIKSRTELLPDLKGLRRPSSSIVERTSAPPSSFMERHRSNLLVAAGLASARHEAKNPFLTPQNLLIMAIYEIPESFVEVSLTHPSLACDMLLVSLCFRDSRDLSFKLFDCLIHLLYVCKIMLLNFVSYVPLFGFD